MWVTKHTVTTSFDTSQIRKHSWFLIYLPKAKAKNQCGNPTHSLCFPWEVGQTYLDPTIPLLVRRSHSLLDANQSLEISSNPLVKVLTPEDDNEEEIKFLICWQRILFISQEIYFWLCRNYATYSFIFSHRTTTTVNKEESLFICVHTFQVRNGHASEAELGWQGRRGTAVVDGDHVGSRFTLMVYFNMLAAGFWGMIMSRRSCQACQSLCLSQVK